MSDQEETPGDEASQSVQNRMAARFETDHDDGGETETGESSGQPSSHQSDTGSDAEPTQSAQRSENEGNAQSAWNAKNVKSEWTGVTVYLPDHLRNALDDEYRRLDFEVGGEGPNGESLRKDRHFKPLVMALGMERMSGMEGQELMERMERMVRHELLDEIE